MHDSIQADTLLRVFIHNFKAFEDYSGKVPIVLDGHTLSIPAVAATASSQPSIFLNQSQRAIVEKARSIVDEKLSEGKSIYGVSTGFGGSADTRTHEVLALGMALIEHQSSGLLPSRELLSGSLRIRPFNDPLASLCMPEAWVRGAMLVRANSLLKGYSASRWDVIDTLRQMLEKNITPMVPVRGSVSASGDLSPLSYVALAVAGEPSVRVFCGPLNARRIVSADQAFQEHGISPVMLQPKEHLSILNGTAFSSSVAAIVLKSATDLAMLVQVCTAFATEALLGMRASHDPFLHETCRPHPGQVECASTIFYLLEGSRLAKTSEPKDISISEDSGSLRQDRYPLRTSPQYIGPQLEDILASIKTLTVECNSATDNPLVDPISERIHHGGNFQAMSITNAMEKTRLALYHFGKLLFAQSSELVNPAFNSGLPPSIAATNPSLDYMGKGIDIALAAYVAEMGFLANPVGTHAQSAELHNQAVNSMALVSARATLTSVELLSMIIASYLYLLCQAVELRALQAELLCTLDEIAMEALTTGLGGVFCPEELQKIAFQVVKALHVAFDASNTQDAVPRLRSCARAAKGPIVDAFSITFHLRDEAALLLDFLPTFERMFVEKGEDVYHSLRVKYLSGAGSTAVYLGRTRAIYEFIRGELGVGMRGQENLVLFENGINENGRTLGDEVSLIYEAIQDGRMQKVLFDLFNQ